MKHNDKMEILKEWSGTVEEKLTTHKSYAKEEFTYPMWFRSKYGEIIVRFISLDKGIVAYASNEEIFYKIGMFLSFQPHTDTTIWQQVENPDLVTDIDKNKAKNPNSKHYELWENFEAIDVIKLALTDEEYKGFLKGNILKYRLRAGKKNIENDNIIKDINKSIDYERELSK